MINKKFLEIIKKKLSKYNDNDLLATLGGLQLVPENVANTIRFEFLAHILCSIQSKKLSNRLKIPLKQLEKFCNCDLPELQFIISQEDPCNNLFTESFTFHGGCYIVFPGIAEQQTFILQHLAKAIFLCSNSSLHKQFKTEIHRLLLAVLLISNEIAKRAGLCRGITHNSVAQGNIYIPKYQELNKFKKSVTFTKSELVDLLTKNGSNFSALENLIVSLGNVSLTDYNLENGELLTHPIVKTIDEQFIVAIPGMLLTAARHQLISLAVKYNVKEKLVELYNEAVWDTVVTSLSHIAHRLIENISIPAYKDRTNFQDGFFQFDIDKIAYVSLITDPLDDYDLEDPFKVWKIKFGSRIKEIHKFISEQVPQIKEILFLNLSQGFGGYHAIELTNLPKVKSLLMLNFTAADFETISTLEFGNSLVLWKYAKASYKSEEKLKILTFGELDKFSIYRQHNYSFYITDENCSCATFMGMAKELREELIKKRDYHGAPSYNPDHIIEVTSVFGTKKVPIYIPTSLLNRKTKRIAYLVEKLPIKIWILSFTDCNQINSELRGFYHQFCELITYWLWQFTPQLKPIFKGFVHKYKQIVIEIELTSDDGWLNINSSENKSEQKEIEIITYPERGFFKITFSSLISSWLQTSDNDGERKIMHSILSAFQELLSEQERQNLSDNIIQQIVDKYAPLGIKKKLLFLDNLNNPELDTSQLPRYRPIQKADENELLDELGYYLRTTKNVKQGLIPKEKQTEVLNNAVEFFYQELKTLVASLHPEKLLENLIQYHEAIIKEVAQHSLTMPTRLACFSSDEEIINNIQEEMAKNNAAAVASRFVIEYVVTQPPSGNTPLSLSIYDHLQAIAYQIINFGFQSDLINFKLAEFELSILPSGRLGTDRGKYEKARKAYTTVWTDGEIFRTKENFDKYWQKINKSSQKPDIVTQIDNAASVEFGYSITELHKIIGEAFRIGKQINPTVACLSFRDFVTCLAQELNWTEKRVEQAIELLCLKPRSNFLKPNSPFKSVDVYPWKFNRSLSYLRRPFLIHEYNGELQVIWGIRHLNSVVKYLKDICFNARLKANTDDMKKIMSHLRNIEGEYFNERVADLCEKNPRLIVKRQVKKIGKNKIARNNGNDLGDIDVLVANPRKKILQVIECKNLELARTPHEMANEIEQLFIGKEKNNGKDRSKSFIEKHQARVDWINAYLTEVLNWLGLNSASSWKVEGLVITSCELFTPHIHSSNIQVFSFVQFAKIMGIEI